MIKMWENINNIALQISSMNDADGVLTKVSKIQDNNSTKNKKRATLFKLLESCGVWGRRGKTLIR